MLTIQSKQRVKRLIASAFGLFGTSYTQNLSVILNYHSIHPSHAYSTSPADFLEQMQYVKTNFTVMSLSELYEMRSRKARLPARAAVITFDDGFKDNYEYAYPILKELGLSATIFLTTGFVNGDIDITKKWEDYCGLGHLDWHQVKEMSENGIYFGAHTHSHPVLTGIALSEAEWEIVQSKQILEEKLGESPKHFAYPFGQQNTYNSSIIEILKKHGFELACSTNWGTRNDDTDIFALPRVRIDSCDSLVDFIAKINGHWNFINLFQMAKSIKVFNKQPQI